MLGLVHYNYLLPFLFPDQLGANGWRDIQSSRDQGYEWYEDRNPLNWLLQESQWFDKSDEHPVSDKIYTRWRGAGSVENSVKDFWNYGIFFGIFRIFFRNFRIFSGFWDLDWDFFLEFFPLLSKFFSSPSDPAQASRWMNWPVTGKILVGRANYHETKLI